MVPGFELRGCDCEQMSTIREFPKSPIFANPLTVSNTFVAVRSRSQPASGSVSAAVHWQYHARFLILI